MRLNAIKDLASRPGPFVTVHTEVGRPTEDARSQLDARWTTIRHTLESEGVGADLLEEISSRLQEAPAGPGEARRTIVACDGEVVFDDVLLGRSPWPESVGSGALPDLAGWVAQADRQVPFALVVADREGADIGFHRGLGIAKVDESEVQGDDFPITKVPQGDWAQKQFQQSAENTWRRNAGEVADAVRSGVREHRPELVVLAGEERGRAEVAAALEDLQVPLVQVEEGGRAAGSSDEALWNGVAKVLAEFEARDGEHVGARLQEATGQGTGAAQGLDKVLDALVAGQVERLVIDLEAVRGLSVDPAQHPGLAVPDGISGAQPADRVLLAAAANTDAEVSVLPRSQTEGPGVAAILRWDR